MTHFDTRKFLSTLLLGVAIVVGGCQHHSGNSVGPVKDSDTEPARLSKVVLETSSARNVAIVVTVEGEDEMPIADVEVAFSQSISGRLEANQWVGTTDVDGQASLVLGGAGMYRAKVTDGSGTVLDMWGSIPLNVGPKNVLTLAIGGDAIIHPSEPSLRVMTRNLYLGASINPVLGAPSLQVVPEVVAQVWAKIQAANFPDRAKMIAREIAANRPHLVGLQEAMVFRRQFPGDFLAGNPQQAEDVVFDFLALLLGELDRLGQNYTAVAMATGLDVEVPSATGEDIRMTDRVVVLARADVEVANRMERNYQVQLPLHLGGPEGVPLNIPRSLVGVDATVNGKTLRFVTTHLEQGLFAEAQVAQGMELLQTLAEEALPVVLVGDFNSAAKGSTTPTYANLVAGGLVDAWKQVHPYQPGYTCCFNETLKAEDFNRRIDHILVRGEIDIFNAGLIGRHRRSSEGLRPSDHLGMAAVLGLTE